MSAIDRSASNDDNREIAELVFRKTGILYEPKRGEYSDSLRKRYIEKADIVERSLFTRLMHIACGRYALAVERKMMRKTGGVLPELSDEKVIDIFSELYEIYMLVSHGHQPQPAEKIINDLAFSVFVRAYRMKRASEKNGAPGSLPVYFEEAKGLWKDFEEWGRAHAEEFFAPRIDKKTGVTVLKFSLARWKKHARFPKDVATYVDLLERVQDAKVASVCA